MDTLLPGLTITLVPSPVSLTTTTVSVAASFVDDQNPLTLTSSLGSTSTSSSAFAGGGVDYSNYYQTAAYVESLSDEDLAKLTTEIDDIIIENNKAKVLVNTRLYRSSHTSFF